MKFLEDDQIMLRAVEPDDYKLLYDIENDSTQWNENGMMAPYSRYNLQEYARNYDADPIRCGQLRLMIVSKDLGNVLGVADLYDISIVNRTAFVGIYILPEFREHGYAHKTLELVETYARILLNLRVLGVKISEKNCISLDLFKDCGYEKAGELKSWILRGKDSYSLFIYTKSLL